MPLPFNGGGIFCILREDFIMKKFFAMFFALILALCGCVSAEPEIDPNLFTIKVTFADSENITFELHNNSKDTIEFGADYYIEYKDGEEWVPMEEKGEYFFTMIAHILEPGGVFESGGNIAQRYGALSSGTYRVYKDIRILNEDGMVSGTQRAYGEFEIIAIER